MLRLARLLTLVSAVLLAIAVDGIGPASRAQTLSPRTLPPPVAYRLRVLPNGLKVYSVLEPGAASVAVQVWYGVGAKNDPPGRSGFAHLFEHLMFKGARDLPPEYMDRLTDDVGGMNNASTDNDYTEYDELVPAADLERLLWAELQRMSSLVVDRASLSPSGPWWRTSCGRTR